MLITILILNLINLTGILIAGVIFFKRNYTIMAIEEWNTIAAVFNACAEYGLINENNEFIPPSELPVEEKAGGVGSFFRDCIEETEEEYEEE